MTERHPTDLARDEQITEPQLAIATLVGRYIERREHHATPHAQDLIAAAAEFGDSAVDELRTLLAFYEAMRASEHAAG